MDSTHEHNIANFAERRKFTLRGQAIWTNIVKELEFIVTSAKAGVFLRLSLRETHLYQHGISFERASLG